MTNSGPSTNDERQALYERMLDACSHALGGELYCLFSALCGRNWESGKKLAFYGRAPNGWRRPLSAGELASELPMILKFGVEDSICEHSEPRDHYRPNGEACKSDPATHWIIHEGPYKKLRNTNWARSTPYWRVVENIMNPGGSRKDWHSEIMFSQLYKLAPWCSNPDETLQQCQLSSSRDLLLYELSKYKPRAAIFLTERNPRDKKSFKSEWFDPFERAFDPSLPNRQDLYIRKAGTVRLDGWDCKIVVSVRPENVKCEALAQAILGYV